MRLSIDTFPYMFQQISVKEWGLPTLLALTSRWLSAEYRSDLSHLYGMVIFCPKRLVFFIMGIRTVTEHETEHFLMGNQPSQSDGMCDSMSRWMGLKSIVVVALGLRLIFLWLAGPIEHIDTILYRSLANTLTATGQFASRDPSTGELEAYTMRTPGYPLIWSCLQCWCGNEEAVEWVLVGIQIVASCISVIIVLQMAALAFGPRVGIIAGWLCALDPWQIIFASTLLTEALFVLAVASVAYAGIVAIQRNNNYAYLGLGLLVGLAMYIRPVFKFYWVAVLMVFFINRCFRLRVVKHICAFLFGMAVMVTPWIVRNGLQTNYWGMDTTQTINLLWLLRDQIPSPSTADWAANPQMARAQELYNLHPDQTVGRVLILVRRDLHLGAREADALIQKIALKTLTEHPKLFLLRVVKNLINFYTAPSTFQFALRSITGNTDWEEVSLMDSFRQGFYLLFISNLGVRFLSVFLLILLPFYGLLYGLRATETRLITSFLMVSILYFTLVTVIVAGTDRYRLPIHPFLCCLSAIAMLQVREGHPLLAPLKRKIKGSNYDLLAG